MSNKLSSYKKELEKLKINKFDFNKHRINKQKLAKSYENYVSFVNELEDFGSDNLQDLIKYEKWLVGGN